MNMNGIIKKKINNTTRRRNSTNNNKTGIKTKRSNMLPRKLRKKLIPNIGININKIREQEINDLFKLRKLFIQAIIFVSF